MNTKNLRKTLLPFLFLLCFANSVVGQIVNIEDRRSVFTDSTGWYENLNLGFGLVKNKQSVVNIDGSFQIEVRHKHRIFLSITKFNFIRAGEDRFVNEGFQHLRFNRFVSNNIDFETFGQAQYNQLVFINLRALAGSGLKFRLINKAKQKFNLGIAVMYEYNEVADSDNTRNDIRGSSYLSVAINLSDNATFSSTTYFQPLHNKIADYRLSTESNLRLKIFKSVDFVTSFSLAYDSRIPEEFPETTYSLKNGLSYSF